MHREATRALVGDGSGVGVTGRDPQVDRLSALVERSFDRALTRLDEVDSERLERLGRDVLRVTLDGAR